MKTTEKILEERRTIRNLQKVYIAMKHRCTNVNYPEYPRYGGRAITICDDWLTINGSVNFINWALNNGYKPGLEIDRRDNDGGYSPDNCRFVIKRLQQRNTSTNRSVTFKDVVYNSIAEVVELLYPDYTRTLYSKIAMRIKRGWNVESALQA